MIQWFSFASFEFSIGNRLLCTCALYWMREAMASFDSVERTELATTDCWEVAESPKRTASDEEEMAAEGDKFEDLLVKQNNTLAAFLLSPQVAQQCGLPDYDSKTNELTVPIETIDTLDNNRPEDEDAKHAQEEFRSRLISEHEKHHQKSAEKPSDGEKNPENRLNQAGAFGAGTKEGGSSGAISIVSNTSSFAILLSATVSMVCCHFGLVGGRPF